MKSQYVKELAEGSRVDAPFVLSAKEMRCSRTGDAYLALELTDRSGRISGVWFRPGGHGSALPVGTVVRVSGTVTTFRGVKRVSVDGLAAAQGWAADDMLATGTRDRDEVVAELRTIAASVSSPTLRRVLGAVFGDPTFFELFTTCPGAQSYHHAYLGGLIEHTVAVARVCATLSELYADVDHDVLLTAALLHDVGKVDELSWDSAINYSDEGRLLGHVVLGERRVREAAAGLRHPPPPEVLNRLSHALLAHHGELEWGSPKRPSTLEALLLHHADNLDAKAHGFVTLMSGAAAVEERWTDTDNLFRRPLYVPAPAQAAHPLRPVEDAQYAQTGA